MPEPIQAEVVQFEVNTTCNMRCRICPLVLREGREAHEVDFSEFQSIFEANFAPPYMIIFSGFSEALLNTDLGQMIEWEKARGNRVLVATNGKLLDREAAATLLDLRVDQVAVSLDSVLPAIYEGLRPGLPLAGLLDNLRTFQRAISERDAPTRVVINSVVTRSTSPHLDGVLDFLTRVGIGDWALIKVMLEPDARSRSADAEYLSWEEYEALGLDSLLERAQARGVHAFRSDPRVLETKGCQLPGHSFYLNADFDVSSCPFASFHPGFVFGNLRERHLREIFDEDAYAAFRKRFERRDHPAMCHRCACLFSSPTG